MKERHGAVEVAGDVLVFSTGPSGEIAKVWVFDDEYSLHISAERSAGGVEALVDSVRDSVPVIAKYSGSLVTHGCAEAQFAHQGVSQERLLLIGPAVHRMFEVDAPSGIDRIVDAIPSWKGELWPDASSVEVERWYWGARASLSRMGREPQIFTRARGQLNRGQRTRPFKKRAHHEFARYASMVPAISELGTFLEIERWDHSLARIEPATAGRVTVALDDANGEPNEHLVGPEAAVRVLREWACTAPT